MKLKLPTDRLMLLARSVNTLPFTTAPTIVPLFAFASARPVWMGPGAVRPGRW